MTAPRKFVKLPVTIEAMRWDGTAEGATPIIDWILGGGGTARWRDEIPGQWLDGESPDGGVTEPIPTAIQIVTLEGTMEASPGDWIIRGLAGEFYPCKPDIFEASYASGDEEAMFHRWLEQDDEHGWVMRACETHDQVPWTRYEEDQFEEGGDPCIPILRVWGPGGIAAVEREQAADSDA